MLENRVERTKVIERLCRSTNQANTHTQPTFDAQVSERLLRVLRGSA